ncbi:MAG TPA: amidohydrolase family protein, partial [Candidatus Lokiarchaeia archaeon]|nr:amidohydrolase family protein [Candidatus Lokiarchaeia archaeon]
EGDKLAVHLAQIVNDEAGRLIAEFPNNFGAFATLPLPNIPASLQEAVRALDDLKLNGFALLTNYNGIYLGDPQFNDLMVELNQRAAVVFIHPTSPFRTSINLPYPAPIVEFPFETTRTAMNLVFSGTLKKFPAVKFILAHAGGTIPFLAGRIAATSLILRDGAKKAPRGAPYYLKRLYYDTALSTDPAVLRNLREFAPLTQILYGSDFPYVPEPLLQDFNNRLDSSAVFSEEEMSLICSENARNLLSGSP